jgi:hypothetical protein
MRNDRELSFSGEEATEERLRALAANTELESLTIWGGPLTNERKAPLRQLTRLKSLTLGEMEIDDGFFRYLDSRENSLV